MAGKTVGELIKEARTGAGLSQAALAAQIEGLSASDIGKAERGEKALSQAALKAIAKATGVTQKSLLEAAQAGEKKPAAKKAEAIELTSAEKTMLSAWRKADAQTRKAALRLLRGEKEESGELGADDLLGTLLSGAMDVLGNLGKK